MYFILVVHVIQFGTIRRIEYSSVYVWSIIATRSMYHCCLWTLTSQTNAAVLVFSVIMFKVHFNL